MSGGEIKRVKPLRSVGSPTAASPTSPVTSPASVTSLDSQVPDSAEPSEPRDPQARSSRYTSYLRPVDGYIDGWIIDQQSPGESTTIDVFVDEIRIATTIARLERPHLKKKFGIASSTHGFRILVPNVFRDGKPHTVSLAVVGSGHRRVARDELQISPTDVAPYLEIVAISEGSLSGRLYCAKDPDIGAPELWVGASPLGSSEAIVEWGTGGAVARNFRIVLQNCSAEELMIQSAEISVAYGWESGHGLPLSSFVAPRVERVSAAEIAVGAAIPFPVLDQAKCRLELYSNGNPSGAVYNFTVDLSLGINDIALPNELRRGEFWARLLLLGAPAPVELLAPTLIPEFSAVRGSTSPSGGTRAEFGAIYVYEPVKAAAKLDSSDEIDPSIRLEATASGPPRGRLSVATDAREGIAYLRLTTDPSGDESVLRFVFSAPDLQAGDLLHVRWFGRAVALPSSDKASRRIGLSFSVDGNGSGEAWSEAVPSLPEWRDHHTIIRMPVPAEQMAVEFTAPAGCMVDFGGLAVGKIANAADTSPKPLADAATVALADVVSYRIEQPLPAIAPASYRRFGLVAKLSSDGISGIAWSQENIRRSTQLQLLVDGKMAGFASAEPLGSFDKGVSPGFFSAALPLAARDALPHEIDVQFMGTRDSLVGAPRALTVDSRHDGVAWLTPEGDIAGWAADPDEAAGPIEVEIRVDGHPVGRMIADAQHPMFSDPAHNNGRCAFNFSVPSSVRDGRLHTIVVRTSAGVELSGSPILATLKKERYTLHIDPTLSGWIKGWVVTATTSASTGVVEIAVNGEYFGTVRAERSNDGGVAGKGARFRFSFRVPGHAAKVRLSSPELGVDAELDVVRVGDTSTLSPSEEIAPTAEGHFLRAKKALLAAPSQHVDADWYFAMYPIASSETANGRRQSAADHWLQTGAKRGWSPNPWFDEKWYLARNPDAAAAVEGGQADAGYLHWLAIGAREWRTPGPKFNPVEYRRTRPLAAENTGEETAFDVVCEWLAELADRERAGQIVAEEQVEAAPPQPGRSLFRRMVTSRWDKATMFDTHVGRLLEDLRVMGHANLDVLRRSLDENEVEIVQNVMDYEGKDEPLVSIIMPTFNRAYVIAEGIQSVLEQSWQNWELIICDDGSFDKTPQVVRQFTDPRIRYLQLEKSNGAIARNYGIKFSRGQYIAFLDSDNIWHPLFLTLTINKILSSLRPAVYTGYIDVTSNAARYTEAVLKFAPFDYLALVARNYIDLNSLVVRRDLFDALGAFDESLPRVQDWDLALRLLRYFDPIEVRCAVAFYRRNPSWGQVTDLAAHTDYTKVVRQRALDRLSGRISAETSLPQQTVSLYAGSTSETLEISLAFAKLLSSVAEVQLVLHDAPAQRSALGRFDLQGRVRVSWLRGQDRLSDHLAGRVLFVPDQSSSAELDGVPAAFPVAEFLLSRERLVVRDRRFPDDAGITLGALRPDVVDDAESFREPEAAGQDRGNSVAVLTAAPMRQRWARALARRKLRATLFWYEGSQIQVIEVDKVEGKAETRSFRDQLGRIDRYAVLVLAAGTGEERLRSASLGIEAQRQGTVLVVGADALYEDWVTGKYAHLAPDDPEAASDLLIKVLNDRPGNQRLRTRSRRLFDYLYRSEAARIRLSISISLL